MDRESKITMNILYFVADGINEYNSSRWRVATPFNGINSKDLNHRARIASSNEWMKQSPHAKQLCEWADLISIQRVGIEKSIPAIKYWRSRGKAVVIDYDDDYFRINKSNAAYKFWGNGMVDITIADGTKFQSPMKRHPLTQFIEGSRACTAVTMPSRLLADDAKKHTESFFIPNYLEKRLYPKQNTKPYDKDRIVIGWGGSLSHVESFEHSGIVPALKNILGEMDNVYLLIVGDDRVVKKLIEMGLRKDRITHHPYVPYNLWYETLQLYDIGIAPLAQEYDMRRSWIKVAEYLSMGIPFAATDGEPYQYQEIRDNLETGIFVEQGEYGMFPNEYGWEHALRKMIDELPETKPLAQSRASEYFDIFDIESGVYQMIDTYQDIIDLEKENVL